MTNKLNESNIREISKYQKVTSINLRISEGCTTVASSPPDVEAPSPMIEFSRLEHTQAGTRRSSTSDADGGSDVLLTTPPTLTEQWTQSEQVGALAVSQDSVSLRPTWTKEKRRQGSGAQNEQTVAVDLEIQQPGEVDESGEHQDASFIAKPEGNETLVEAEVAPDLEALVQERLEEERQNQHKNGSSDNSNVLVATATPAEDSNGKRGKRIIQALVAVGVFVGVAIAAAALLQANDDDDSVPVILSPTSSPTTLSLYEANSADVCAGITTSKSVPNQSTMIFRSFEVLFDVSLMTSGEQSALPQVVNEMEKRLQRFMAPKLADCPGYRRLLSDEGDDRKLAAGLDRNVIGNARFFLKSQSNESCDASAPTLLCYRVRGELDLYLKADQDISALANHVTTTLREDMDLTPTLQLTDAPFEKIQYVGMMNELDAYPPSTQEACAAISRGQPIGGQDKLFTVAFDILMDVSLTLELSDFAELAKEMQPRMQQIMGPRLADCERKRRLQQEGNIDEDQSPTPRLLQHRPHVVANALFGAIRQEDQSCDSSAPIVTCIRTSTRLTLWLRGEEETYSSLTNFVTEVFNPKMPLAEKLRLSSPFSAIEMVSMLLVSP